MELEVPTKKKSTLLANVPKHIYSEYTVDSVAQQKKERNGTQSYSVDFNVAVWLKLNEPIRENISAWLEYHDSKGTKRVLIEKNTAGTSKHLMMSSRVNVKFRGSITNMRVTCDAENHVTPNISVDELFVQPIKQTKRFPVRSLVI